MITPSDHASVPSINGQAPISLSLSLSLDRTVSLGANNDRNNNDSRFSVTSPARSIAQGVLLYKSEFHFLIPLRLYYIQVAAISIVDSYIYRALLKK